MGAGLTEELPDEELTMAQAGKNGVAAPMPVIAVVFKNFRRLIAIL